MQFAEEHEEEAEQVEAEVHAQESGGSGGAQEPTDADKEKAGDAVRQQVMAKVLDMLAEAGRVGVDRNGPPARRP
jgi:hypothetical protein